MGVANRGAASVPQFLADAPPFPRELTDAPQWLCWRLFYKSGNPKLQKDPCNPANGKHASSSNPDTWCSYTDALAAVRAGRYEGLGLALTKQLGLAVLDIENCIKDGEVEEWARREIEALNSLTEISASGTGIHVLSWGAIPSNINRQKISGELWDSEKMFCLTGNIYEGRDSIAQRDLSNLHARMLRGSFGPNHKHIVAETGGYGSQRFRDLCGDDWGQHGFSSRSDVVQSVLCTLAIEFHCDPEKMRAEFEQTALCANWFSGGKWKWERLGDREIASAIDFVQKNAKQGDQPKVLTFSSPRESYTNNEFVLAGLESKYGWFPLGLTSLVVGHSGSGKTRWVWDLLRTQRKSEPVLDHATISRPYLVIMADRGSRDIEQTLESMNIDATVEPIAFIPTSLSSFAAAQEIVRKIEQFKPVPKIVFIEGADMLAKNPSDPEKVIPWLEHLKDIADHFNCAIVGSVGSPKTKVGEGYTATRDKIYGCIFWGRMTSTIVLIDYLKGDDTDERRLLTALPRNAKPEKFRMRMDSTGQLIRDTQPEQSAEEEEIAEGLHWLNAQTDWFSRGDVEAALLCSPATAKRHLQEWRRLMVLQERGRGPKTQYQRRAAQTVELGVSGGF